MIKKELKLQYEAIIESNKMDHNLLLQKGNINIYDICFYLLPYCTVQLEYEKKMTEKEEFHQSELDTIAINNKNKINALVNQYDKELESINNEMMKLKEEKERTRSKREEDWVRTHAKRMNKYSLKPVSGSSSTRSVSGKSLAGKAVLPTNISEQLTDEDLESISAELMDVENDVAYEPVDDSSQE